MSKVIIRAEDFKRLINSTKKFIRKDATNKLMGYIHLEFNSETNEVKAEALDGHRVAVEYAHCYELKESFSCLIKPDIPKIKTKYDFVEVELVNGKCFVTVGEDIRGYVQPEGEWFKTAKLFSDTEKEEILAKVCINSQLLIDALASTEKGYSKNVYIELRKTGQPVVVRSGNKHNKGIKLVLPMRTSD